MMGRIKKSVITGMLMMVVSIMLPGTVNAQQMMLEPQYVQEIHATYDDAYTEGNYEYVIENGTATITNYLGEEENVVVPATIGGYSVKKVANSAFMGKMTIRSITISEGIETLENGWIIYCSVESIHLPSTVKADLSMLCAEGELLNVSYLDKWKTITVDEKNPWLTVYNGDLYTKDMTVFVAHPAAVTKDKLVLPDSVKVIANQAFALAQITEIYIPDTVEYIGEYAFQHSVILNLSIPKKCKKIAQSAYGYSGISSITIPASLTEIGAQAFMGSPISEITVDENNKKYSVKEGCLYSETDKRLLLYPKECTATEFNIPEGTKIIGAGAFAHCDSLKKITIPDSVTEIEKYSFWNCQYLRSLSLPSGLKAVGEYAFAVAWNLNTLYFKGNCPQLGVDVFYQLYSTIYYPASNDTWNDETKQTYGGNKIVWAEQMMECEAPTKPYKIANVVSGVHIYWNAVTDAAKYGVWRSETGKDGTYKWLANPTVPHFTDTKAESGKTYYYKVSALSYSNKHSDKSGAIGIIYVSTPDITKRANEAAGVQLGWDKVNGATGYAIYRKSYSGDDAWTRVATISGNDTFTWIDTTVKNNNGTVYKYTIRALAGSDRKTLSGCRNAGRTMVRLSSQVLSSAVKVSSTSVKCSWTTSSKVTGYEVRFMVGNNVYKTYTVGNYITGTKTFKELKEGQNYSVQVRTYKKVDGVGTFYSAWSTAKSVGL